jgi:hypothetical protein
MKVVSWGQAMEAIPPTARPRGCGVFPIIWEKGTFLSNAETPQFIAWDSATMDKCCLPGIAIGIPRVPCCST